MSTFWYSITISLQSTTQFSGYLKVESNLVTLLYQDNNFNTNKLIYNDFPKVDDKIFNVLTQEFTSTGMNFIATVNGNTDNYNLSTTNSIFSIFIGSNYFTVDVAFELLLSDPSCFNKGTKILCLNNHLEEEYIPIENLKKGDLVKSYKHGYRRIELIGKNDMINNTKRFNQCMYKMLKTDENGLIDDLIVTGGHGILVDDLGIHKEENDKLYRNTNKTPLIDNKYLLLAAVSSNFIKVLDEKLYTYYHFTLENNDDNDERFGVWANGILTETPSKNQFNKHKYTLICNTENVSNNKMTSDIRPPPAPSAHREKRVSNYPLRYTERPRRLHHNLPLKPFNKLK
jgi:hypothetical protein